MLLLTFFGLYFLIMDEVKCSSSSSSLSSESGSLEDVVSSLLDIPINDDSEESTMEIRDLKDYHKVIAKQEQKNIVEMFRMEESEEDKKRVKFYEDILKKVKEFGKKTG